MHFGMRRYICLILLILELFLIQLFNQQAYDSVE